MPASLAAVAPAGVLADAFGRVQDYLRLSVTDRCNFRCTYCLPPDGVSLCPPKDLLGFDEIEAVVRALAGLGVRKVRLTGGEPLLRPGLPELVERLLSIPGIHELGLTTNGDRLAAQARPLREAGLRGVNVSIDSLDAGRFHRVTGGGRLERVWEGILEALSRGLKVKLNCVVLADLSFDEVRRFVALAKALPVAVRFIEFMPLCGERWDASAFVPLQGIEDRLRVQWPRVLEPIKDDPFDGVARRFRVLDGAGELGFIASTSRPFCDRCSRLRLTAQGRLHTCLFSADGTDLRPFLQMGDEEGLREAVQLAVRGKPRIHGGDRPLSPDSPPPSGRIRMVGG